MRKIIVWGIGIIFSLIILFIGNVFYTLWQHEVFKEFTYDTQAPPIPDLGDGKKVFLFSKTHGFRHIDAIPAAQNLFRDIAVQEDWGLFISDNAAVHNMRDLAQFDLIIWNNVTGDVLTQDQRTALKDYMESGGKFLGIHGTGGTRKYDWAWHPAELIAAQFLAHPLTPQFQDAHVLVEDGAHPAMAHLPEIWPLRDEWYSFTNNPRGRAHILATLDETTYRTDDWIEGDLSMGGDHPVIWHHRIKEGYVFYSSIGHLASLYEDENYRRLLHQAALWLLTRP